jgi:hypothetical protein
LSVRSTWAQLTFLQDNSGTAGGLAVLLYEAIPQFYFLEAQGLTHADMGI